ncbi:MAG: ABC transporter permease [Lachnospiraceae bacterium]|nr:ABC transporter permease [Lachnospiraceae bacterium]
MVYYEIKKVFSKTSNKIAVLLILVLLGLMTGFAVHVEYVNEEGNKEYGISAAHKLKEMKKEWAGQLTEERLKEAIAENARIQATPEARSRDMQQKEVAYSQGQGLQDIRSMIANSYGGFQEHDYYMIDYLKPEDAGSFYSNRTESLKEYLASPEAEQFSEKEKQFLIEQYADMEVPLKYDDFTGWYQATYNMSIIIMLMCLIFGFLLAGIFSNETKLKADSIFFSAYHGRRKGVMAKLAAGLVIVTGIYWGVMLVYSAIVLGALGTDGADCMIQISLGGWKSFYNITFLQRYLLILFGGYLGTLFISLLTMLVSAKTKSAVISVMIPFILLLIPSFLSGGNHHLLNQILAALPDRLMELDAVVKTFSLVEIGGKVTGTLSILFPVYTVLSVILCPVIYQVYRQAEVK